MTISILTTNWNDSSKTLTDIRNTVFVIEQHVPEALEIDDLDPIAIHFLAKDDISKQSIGTARLLNDGHIGRMAVLKSWRGKGIGTKLLKQAIAHAQKLNLAHVQLNAQVNAIDFYRKAGFSVSGEIFEDAGIDHVKMILPINR